MDKLVAAEQVAVCQQLGYSNVMDVAVLDMHYSLRMNYEDEYQVSKKRSGSVQLELPACYVLLPSLLLVKTMSSPAVDQISDI